MALNGEQDVDRSFSSNYTPSSSQRGPATMRTVASYSSSALASSSSTTMAGANGGLFEPLLTGEQSTAATGYGGAHAPRPGPAVAPVSIPLPFDSLPQPASAGGHHGFGVHDVLAHEAVGGDEDMFMYTPAGSMAAAGGRTGARGAAEGHPAFAVPAHLLRTPQSLASLEADTAGGVGSPGFGPSDSMLSPRGDLFDSYTYATTPLRWWVLGTFCWLSFMQSFIWVSYSPITKKTQEYYSCSEAQVDLVLNWGPIISLPSLPFVMKMGSSARGLRRLVFGTAWLVMLACLIKLIPEIGGGHGSGSTLFKHALPFIHLAHILNAAAGTVLMATVTKLSCLWFPAEERTISTSLLVIACQTGGAGGYLLAPALVKQATDMPVYLYTQAGMMALGFLAVFPLHPRLFFPERPKQFPSRAAAEMEMEGGGPVVPGLGAALNDAADATPGAPMLMAAPGPTLWSETKVALRNRSFVLLALSSGIVSGVFQCWAGVLSTVMPADQFSDTTCGWLSFAATVAGVVAGIVVGPLARTPFLRRRLKLLIVLFTLGAAVMSGVFLLLTPSIFSHSALIPPRGGVATMFVAIALLGAMVGFSIPLCFELSVELLYPCWESISGGVLTFLNNAGALIFLAVAPNISGPQMTALLVGALTAAALMLFPIAERYVRMDHEADSGLLDAAMMGPTDTPLARAEGFFLVDDMHGINGPAPGESATRATKAYRRAFNSRGQSLSSSVGGDLSRSVSQQRRGYVPPGASVPGDSGCDPSPSQLLAAQEAVLVQEFAAVARTVDAGMLPSASPVRV